MSATEICRQELSHAFGGGISPRLTYRLIILLSLAEILLMLAFADGIGYEVPDTFSYYKAFGDIQEWRPNRMRPPVYPLLFGGLCGLVGETAGKLMTIVAQTVLFIASLGALRASCGLLWKNQKLTYWVVALYALYPPAPAVACSLISEGVAMPLTVILTLLCLRAIRQPSWQRAVSVGLLAVVLIFTRPSFVFLLVFIPLGWILLTAVATERRPVLIPALTGILMSIAGWILVSGYAAQMEKNYGIRVLTDVSSANNYFLLREAGAIDPETVGNPQARKLIEIYIGREDASIPEITQELWSLSPYMTPEEFNAMIDKNLRLHKGEILKALIGRTYRVALSRLTYLDAKNPFSILIAPFIINFGLYFLLLLLTITIIAKQTVRRHYFPTATFFLWTFSVSMTIVAILGAMNDWGRLVVSGQCVWMLLAASLLNSFRLKKPLPILS